MALKPNKEIIVNALLTEIDFGSSRAECLAINNEKWQIPERTFDRYWAEAASRYQEVAERTKTALIESRVEIEKEALKGHILSRIERMEILTEIAKGTISYEKEVPTKNGPMVITARPEFSDRKNAVAELNKMDGEYAPAKKDITSGGEPLKQITGIIVE